MDNYERLIEKIALSAKMAKEDVERKVEAKRAKLSGLVSKEGAAQIVAAELGINFEKEKIKIGEIASSMKKANVIGKVVEIFPVRGFNKNGREGKVANLVISDDSAMAKAVLWDTNHIALIENGTINVGDVLEISNASVRNGELHLSSFGDIKKSNVEMKNVVMQQPVNDKKIKEASPGQKFRTRAFIVQVFEPRYFEVCPECGKRALEGQCNVHGAVTGVKRALLNLVLDDGSETIRAVLFGEQINKLGLTNDEIFQIEAFLAKKDSLLGEERIFTGNMRANTLYNTNEFSIENIENVNLMEMIDKLEKA